MRIAHLQIAIIALQLQQIKIIIVIMIILMITITIIAITKMITTIIPIYKTSLLEVTLIYQSLVLQMSMPENVSLVNSESDSRKIDIFYYFKT